MNFDEELDYQSREEQFSIKDLVHRAEEEDIKKNKDLFNFGDSFELGQDSNEHEPDFYGEEGVDIKDRKEVG